MKKLWLTPLTFFFVTTAFCQRTVELNVGLNHFLTKDKTVSTLIYSGFVPGLSTAFTFSGDNWIHSVQLHYSSGRIKNRIENSWQVIFGGLNYNAGYKLSDNRYIHSLGLATGLSGMIYTPKYLLENGFFEGDLAGYMSAFLGLYVQSILNLTDRWKLNADYVLPVIEYNFRTGYAASTPDELIGKETATFGELLKAGYWRSSFLQPQILFDLKLIRISHRPITYAFGYSFGFKSFDEPLEFSAVNQIFTFGMILQW